MTTIWINDKIRDWLRSEQERRGKTSANDTLTDIKENWQSEFSMKMMNIPTTEQIAKILREIVRDEIDKASGH